MDLIRHSEWKDTKLTIHLISQILGKIRLEAAYQEPQWAHVMLALTPHGFTTGLLDFKDHWFEVSVDLTHSTLEVTVDSRVKTKKLADGVAVKDYFEFIFQTLEEGGVMISIFPVPQEMSLRTPLNEDTEHRTYDASLARRGFHLFQWAFAEQMKFIGPLRSRKVKPGLFWGTFDVSCLIVSNRPEPFPEDKVIEKAAFDEQFIEYGFWLGDDNVDIPTLFVLPYPFQNKDLNSPDISPPEAYYDKDLSEYFLSLETLVQKENRSSLVQQFFHSTFGVLCGELGWNNIEEVKKPLLMKKQVAKDNG